MLSEHWIQARLRLETHLFAAIVAVSQVVPEKHLAPHFISFIPQEERTNKLSD